MLKLTNSLTRQLEEFKPQNPQNVTLYTCGITPYDYAHIGNLRVMVVFDVLFRLLRHLYGEQHVTYIRNFTDIDDKIIQRAQELNQEPTKLAETYIQVFHQNMATINCLPPTHEPRVSTTMPEIIAMIEALIVNGYAYVAPSGDVMYRTTRFPTFGQLVKRKLNEQHSGSRVQIDTEKESEHDFVLWKANAKSATKLEQAFNPAQYGAQKFNALGRPGWHIECSAMSKKFAGTTLDIHAGGEDLQFPHHSCEIAQSEALSGKPLANIWLHNSFITVGGQKMSKSLGNFTTIPDALKQFPPMALRYWLLQTHYRKPVDFTPQAVQAASKPITRIQKAITAAQNTLKVSPVPGNALGQDASSHPGAPSRYPGPRDEPTHPFLNALNTDLNTSKALAELNKLATTELTPQSAAQLLTMANILGFKAT